MLSYSTELFIDDHHIILSLLLGALLDWIIGDPEWPWHPVRLIGKWIGFLDRHMRLSRNPRNNTPGKQRFRGFCLVVLVLLPVFLITLIPVQIAYEYSSLFGLLLEAVLCAMCLSARNLKEEAEEVEDALMQKDEPGAKASLSMIVGRETGDLTEGGIIRAAVETVAENTTDGVIAPIIFLAIGGAPLGMLYKAVNTMDSMLGYKNEKYLHFGRFAAKLDDLANYIPAWATSFFMTLASFLLGYDGKNAIRVFWKDRGKSPSPNAGKTESVMAGALHLVLGGDAVYGGILCHKPWIGLGQDNLDPVPEDIRNACRIMATTEWILLVLLLLIFLSSLA